MTEEQRCIKCHVISAMGLYNPKTQLCAKCDEKFTPNPRGWSFDWIKKRADPIGVKSPGELFYPTWGCVSCYLEEASCDRCYNNATKNRTISQRPTILKNDCNLCECGHRRAAHSINEEEAECFISDCSCKKFATEGERKVTDLPTLNDVKIYFGNDLNDKTGKINIDYSNSFKYKAGVERVLRERLKHWEKEKKEVLVVACEEGDIKALYDTGVDLLRLNAINGRIAELKELLGVEE